MKRFHRNHNLAMLLFPLISVGVASAVSPDLRLLSLVPLSAQVVAGMDAPLRPGLPDAYLMMTYNNTVDLRDFLALSGVDDSRSIHQVILVAAGDGMGSLAEHSLLATGHFDDARIFKAAVENGASISQYKGTRVLVLQPFERDRGTFKDVRWLAVIDANIALLGTIATVQQELDRHLAHSAADPSLIQNLARLRRDDETWCVLAAFVHNYETRRALGSLDPTLADPAHDGDAFQFGIRYGRHVEFEYELTASSRSFAQAVSGSLSQSLAGPAKGLALLRAPYVTGNGTPMRGVIKLSRARYEAWLAEILSRGCARMPAIS